MEVTWYGDNCVAMREGGVTVLCDPFAAADDRDQPPQLFDDDATPPAQTLTPGFDVDVVTSSCGLDQHPTGLPSLPGDPVVIATPGEFEAKGVFIQSLRLERPADASAASAAGRLAYHFDFGASGLAHLGAPGTAFRPTDRRLVENLIVAKTDILLLPLGRGARLELDWAIQTCKKLEPKVCIPIAYDPADVDRITARLQVLGPIHAEASKRYRVTRKEAAHEGAAIFLLTPSSLSRP